jgi:hypothetical protein
MSQYVKLCQVLRRRFILSGCFVICAMSTRALHRLSALLQHTSTLSGTASTPLRRQFTSRAVDELNSALQTAPNELNNNKTSFDYDLVVIGGGSGGLAAAKEATKVNPNAKVALSL